jgi:hypothetical protein
MLDITGLQHKLALILEESAVSSRSSPRGQKHGKLLDRDYPMLQIEETA